MKTRTTKTSIVSKKVNICSDERFIVDNSTLLITAIKKNDKTLELLDKMRDIIETLSGTWDYSNKPMADNLIYKDAEGNELEQHEFFDNLHHWVDLNQDFLLRDSRVIYGELTKKRKPLMN